MTNLTDAQLAALEQLVKYGVAVGQATIPSYSLHLVLALIAEVRAARALRGRVGQWLYQTATIEEELVQIGYERAQVEIQALLALAASDGKEDS